MSENSVFEVNCALPEEKISQREPTLLGFEQRYKRVHDQLRLLLQIDQLSKWSAKFHKTHVPICDRVSEQYPFVIFHGDVGTGKSVTAEGVANRLAQESGTEEPMLFRLSNRVRGTGKVGEMGTLLAKAFAEVTASIGKKRRAVLIIDEGDSIGASRNQEHSHHEDKVGVNTLIQGLDDLRKHGGRVVTILCTNRLSVLDPALLRRAAIVEEFQRPDEAERRQLFEMDLMGLKLTEEELTQLVKLTGPQNRLPGYTFSDIRTRLYPAALGAAFPDKPLTFETLKLALNTVKPSPVMEDAS